MLLREAIGLDGHRSQDMADILEQALKARAIAELARDGCAALFTLGFCKACGASSTLPGATAIRAMLRLTFEAPQPAMQKHRSSNRVFVFIVLP